MKNKYKKIAQINRRIVTQCKLCSCDLYEGERCYYLQGKYFCKNCVDSAHIELDKKE